MKRQVNGELIPPPISDDASTSQTLISPRDNYWSQSVRKEELTLVKPICVPHKFFHELDDRRDLISHSNHLQLESLVRCSFEHLSVRMCIPSGVVFKILVPRRAYASLNRSSPRGLVMYFMTHIIPSLQGKEVQGIYPNARNTIIFTQSALLAEELQAAFTEELADAHPRAKRLFEFYRCEVLFSESYPVSADVVGSECTKEVRVKLWKEQLQRFICASNRNWLCVVVYNDYKDLDRIISLDGGSVERMNLVSSENCLIHYVFMEMPSMVSSIIRAAIHTSRYAIFLADRPVTYVPLLEKYLQECGRLNCITEIVRHRLIGRKNGVEIVSDPIAPDDPYLDADDLIERNATN